MNTLNIATIVPRRLQKNNFAEI